ncbi:MAG: alpha/beta hydrolase [Nevskiales bacterium]
MLAPLGALLFVAVLFPSTVIAASTMRSPEEPFKFAELFPLREQIKDMRPLEPYMARDGTELSFRRYPAATSTHLILLHGSSAHGAYLHSFAQYLSARNAANVYAPDIRGHGPAPKRRGDIDYIGQLEDDVADLIMHIRKGAPASARFVLGGHSSGGGLAVRFGGSEHGHMAHAILLLAPYLGHDAPMVKRNAGGWAQADIPRIVGLSILNGFGITRFNGARVLRFNLPEKYHSGYETLTYSFRLMKGMHPDNYKIALRNYKGRVLLLVGSQDEAFHADAFKSGILPYKPDANIGFVKDGSHLGIIMSESAMAEATQWLTKP